MTEVMPGLKFEAKQAFRDWWKSAADLNNPDVRLQLTQALFQVHYANMSPDDLARARWTLQVLKDNPKPRNRNPAERRSQTVFGKFFGYPTDPEKLRNAESELAKYLADQYLRNEIKLSTLQAEENL